jgi:IS5 family transposase
MKRTEYTFGDYEIANRLKRLNPENIVIKINEAIDWKPIKQIVSPLDSRKKNKTGRDCYDPIMMFKIQFIQDLKGYSDVQMEERLITDTLYMWFCGISTLSNVPDHSTISRWRDRFNVANVSQLAFLEVNRQLSAIGLRYEKGTVVDASLINSFARLRRKDEIYEIDPNTNEITKHECHIQKIKQEIPTDLDHPNSKSIELKTDVDPDAKLIKVGRKLTYGYKMHTLTDLEGLILNLLTTPANVLEATKLKELLSIFESGNGIEVNGDKGYCWQECIDFLIENGFGDKIMRKKKKGKDMDESTAQFNKSISGVRYVIERTFGGLKRWFNLGRAKYIGLEKTHNHNLRLATIYNVVRLVGVT